MENSKRKILKNLFLLILCVISKKSFSNGNPYRDRFQSYRQTFRIEPNKEETERIINNKSVGYAGISPSTEALNDYRVKVQYPFFESVSKSFDLTVNYTILTFKMIFKLFSGQANMSNISGPLSIAEFSGKSLSMGYVYFAYLLAVLSISLGVLNLLPIPVLDGGHLVYYTIEMILGKPVSIKYQLIGQQLGLLILVGIMLVAFYNDFLRLFSD